MSEESDNIDPEDLTPEAKKALEDFEALMKDIRDPVATGYSSIVEMYTGFRTAGMERIDAYCLVAAYLAIHDHIEREES